MRLKVTLKPLEDKFIDMNYNYYLTSIIYKLLNKSNAEFANILHNQGYSVGDKKFKLFTYSMLNCSKYKIDGSLIQFQDKITWYISSPVNNFVLYFAQSLLDENKIKIGEAEFLVLNVEVLKSLEIRNNMMLKCLSPIVVNTGMVIQGEFKQYYLSPENEKFVENIKNNLLRKYFAFTHKLPADLSFEMKIINIDKCLKGKRISIKDSFVKGYTPIFEVKGSEELIKIGYECGFGSKNSMGLGMVEEYYPRVNNKNKLCNVL